MAHTDNLSVALAHHWLMSMRGGEKTLVHLAELFPEAPIFTLLANRSQLDEKLLARPIHTSWLQRFNFIPDLQRKALPFLFRAARSLDARGHEVVICSDAAGIKAIRTRPDAMKICYCYTPMRYIWDLYGDYYRSAGPAGKLGLRLLSGPLRKSDRRAADEVTAFIAISDHVADRIRRNYDRESVVIYPPTDVDFPPPLEKPEDFYLVVSEMVPYKRVDLAVAACSRLKRRLVVIGVGPQMARLKEQAGESVRFLGWQSDAVVRDHFRRCRAFLFCGQEDFGLTPVEAMAAGRPVIAYRAGGATETVIDGETGLFFDQQTPESLVAAIERFESEGISASPVECRQQAEQFSSDRFKQRFRRFYDWCLQHYQSGGNTAVREAMRTEPPDLSA